MEKTQTYKLHIDLDLKGLSIGIIETYVIEGETVSKPIKRKAFRKYLTDEDGNVTDQVNPDFYTDIDEWTGETDFINNKFNF